MLLQGVQLSIHVAHLRQNSLQILTAPLQFVGKNVVCRRVDVNRLIITDVVMHGVPAASAVIDDAAFGAGKKMFRPGLSLFEIGFVINHINGPGILHVL